MYITSGIDILAMTLIQHSSFKSRSEREGFEGTTLQTRLSYHSSDIEAEMLLLMAGGLAGHLPRENGLGISMLGDVISKQEVVMIDEIANILAIGDKL